MRLALPFLAALLAGCGGGDWDDNDNSEASTGTIVAPYNPNGTLVLVEPEPPGSAERSATPIAP